MRLTILSSLTALFILTSSSLAAETSPQSGLPPPLVSDLKLALDEWSLVFADTIPSVPIENLSGWRLVFAKPFDEDTQKGVSEGKTRFNHIDLVLFRQPSSFDLKKLKSAIPWSQTEDEYFSAMAYLGSGHGYLWFCKSNIYSQDALRDELRLRDGDDRMEILLKGLSIEDKRQFTANVSCALLKQYREKAVPGIRREISTALKSDISPLPHMLALKGLVCKEGDKAILEYLSAGDTRLTDACTQAIMLKPYLQNAKDAYLRAMSNNKFLDQCIEASMQFGWDSDALPILESIAAKPDSFPAYASSTAALKRIKDGKIDETPFRIAKQIGVEALRCGDIAGTPKTFNMGESEAQRKNRLAKQDMERLKPLEDAMAKAPDNDLAIIAAISLCRIKAGNGVSEQYQNRVNESGFRILAALPQRKVLSVIAKLIKNADSGSDAAYFKSILRRLRH